MSVLRQGVLVDATRGGESRVDFFVSYAGPDRPWAEWAAWQLEAAGYTVELDVWDWSAGDNIIWRMNDALARAARLLALYSPAYFERSRFTGDEWTSVLAERPDGTGGRRLVPVRVAEVAPPPVLAAVKYQDLFDRDEHQARRDLLAAVAGVRRPTGQPQYPGRVSGAAGGPRMPGSLPPVWNVRLRNPAFTGRGVELAALRQRLCAGDRALVQALHGMGGVGKTQLAVEYAYLFAGEYELVWWLDAERPELIGEQLSELAGAAGWAAEGMATAATLRLVMQRLRADGRWLLVFDNAETVEHIRDWIPAGGHVIITSRSGQAGGIAVPVGLDVFTRDESVALLRTRVPALPASDADRLAETLGDLPLALAQAAGLLAETGMTVEEYVAELAEHAGQVLSDSPPGDYPRPLAAVITTSVRRLESVDPGAVQLLRLCAMFAPEPIPLAWFHQAPADVVSEPLATVAASRVVFRRSLGRLAAFGLAGVDSDTVQLHRLTQAVLRDTVARAADRDRAQRLLAIAAPDNDGGDPRSWPDWARLLPHLLVLDPLTTSTLTATTRRALLYLIARGDYRFAHATAQAWHGHWSACAATDHPAVLTAQAVLAEAGRHFSSLDEQARQLNEDNLMRCRRIFGDDHPNTLSAANNRVLHLLEMGEYKQAFRLGEDTLARCRRVLGDDHPDTLTVASNLAVNMRRLDEDERAGKLDEDVLARRRRVLGEDHPEALTSANNLATHLHRIGEYARARELAQDTLDRCRRILGEDHPHTLQSAHNLATSLSRLGDPQQARELAQDALDRYRRILGEDHPATLASANDLAAYLHQGGQYARARELAQDTLDRRRRVLGEDHTATLTSASGLVLYLLQLGEYQRALELGADALGRCERILGGLHPETLTLTMNIATGLRLMGDPERARKLEENVVIRIQLARGDDHPDSLLRANNQRPPDEAGGSTTCGHLAH